MNSAFLLLGLTAVFFMTLLHPIQSQPMLRIKIGEKTVTYSYRQNDTTVLIRKNLHDHPGAPLREILQDLHQEDQTILIYAHSMLGHAPLYADMAEAVVRREFQHDALLIILDWGGLNPFYGPWRRMAAAKGKLLGELLSELSGEAGVRVFCHSMGCELIRQWLLVAKDIELQKLVLFAADIHAVDLSGDERCFTRHIRASVMLTSRRDLILRTSDLLHAQSRLYPDARSDSPSFRQIDIDSLKCRGLRHVWWITCPAAQEAVSEALR